MGRYTGKQCRLISMTFLTGSYFVVELVVGYATNSMALVADSFHMLSDLIALIVAFISVKMAPRRWTKNTFGWARAEILGALVNAVFLLALCFSIFVEALKRFADPELISEPVLILYVGSFGLLVNLVGLLLFRDHGHAHSVSKKDQQDLPVYDDVLNEEIKVERMRYRTSLEMTEVEVEKKPSGKKTELASETQMNMYGVFLHILADALGSVIVIVSALIIWLTNWSFRAYVDPLLSVIIVLIISKSTWPLLKQSSLIMLQTVPTHIEMEVLENKLTKEIEEILAVHEFHLWQLAGEKIVASLHIVCHDLDDYQKIAGKIKEFFHREGIHSITIQPEFVNIGQDDIIEECVYPCPEPNRCLPQTCCGNYKDATVQCNVNGDVTNRSRNGNGTNCRNSVNSVSVESGEVNRNFTA
ncbi:proton-coupled zinc antiporter SLC30A1-like [Centruroides vittatus]|uniref:proton-coupled zinc antiporter SLC30A1-like n=1 Tax=Centruroides vittatus TaxID=120091 RepID=UPI00350EE4B1